MAYRLVPLNALTRLAGWAANLHVPAVLRAPVYGAYASLFGCNMAESRLRFESFESFNQFFTRELQAGSRPVDPVADMVSPADGRIMALGRIDVPFATSAEGKPLILPEQIKGISYPLERLLDGTTYADFVNSPPTKPLFYCTIYLSPGSYHRFHSAARWQVAREPFCVSGEALSVAPLVMRLVPSLFCVNERAILAGQWKHGNLAMVPVGATNVRSIKFDGSIEAGKQLEKGDPVGMFELGSTVVLLFNAPRDFEWSRRVGDPIHVGEALGSVKQTFWFIEGLL